MAGAARRGCGGYRGGRRPGAQRWRALQWRSESWRRTSGWSRAGRVAAAPMHSASTSGSGCGLPSSSRPRHCGGRMSVSRGGPRTPRCARASGTSGVPSAPSPKPSSCHGRAVPPGWARGPRARACGARGRAPPLFLPGQFPARPPALLQAPPPWSAASSGRYLILGLCKREGGAWPCPAPGATRKAEPSARPPPHLHRSLKAAGRPEAQRRSHTMPKARSVLVLAGLLALWAELPPASAQNVTTKAGVCPEPATEAVNCTVGCQSDGDCESTLKCCPAACGKACQKPDEKPGTCPPVSPGIPMLGVCTNQCKSDSNCSGNQKCCRNGCGKVSCVTPLH